MANLLVDVEVNIPRATLATKQRKSRVQERRMARGLSPPLEDTQSHAAKRAKIESATLPLKPTADIGDDGDLMYNMYDDDTLIHEPHSSSPVAKAMERKA